jgi:Protein of unknown function (DUF4031)
MGVYVDDARISWRGRRWSHLVAEEADELHRVAARLGLRREWAQERGRTLHYDVPDELRARAIDLGLAEPITWRELARRRATFAAGSRSSRRSDGPGHRGP